MVNIFLSWSGDGHASAEALDEMLRAVFGDDVTPFLSKRISPGEDWLSSIRDALKESQFGIICVTPSTLRSPWLQFEAGALSNAFENKFVVPVLLGISKEELSRDGGPLSSFQAVTHDKDEIFKLYEHLQREFSLLNPTVLNNRFERFYPDFAKNMQILVAESSVTDEPPEGATGVQTDSPTQKRIPPATSLDSITDVGNSADFERDGWLAAIEADALLPLAVTRLHMMVVHPEAGLGRIVEDGPALNGVPYVTVAFRGGQVARVQTSRLFRARFRESAQG